ncbi:MAG: hypothetical protein JW891_09810 [Candidatus Lokiarchaeota archaeon]|nr:hypothetical protein [Candidatus Lokiarchaeota archaeon]
MVSSENKEELLLERSHKAYQKLKKRKNFIKHHEETVNKVISFMEGLSKHENSLMVDNLGPEISMSKGDMEEREAQYARLELLVNEIEEWLRKIDSRIDRFFDIIFEKVPGILFGVLGIFVFFFSTFMALYLYLSVDPNYSILHNWISNLGVGPNNSSAVFNTGWVLSAGIILCFHVYEIRELKKRKGVHPIILKLMIISNASLTFGIFLVGFFPENQPVSHNIAATFYFLGGLSFFLSYGILAWKIKSIPNTHVVVVFVLCFFYLLYFTSTLFPPWFLYLGLTITSTEWLTLFAEMSMMIMILQHSLVETYYKKKYQKEKNFIKKNGLKDSKYGERFKQFLEDYRLE